MTIPNDGVTDCRPALEAAIATVKVERTWNEQATNQTLTIDRFIGCEGVRTV